MLSLCYDDGFQRVNCIQRKVSCKTGSHFETPEVEPYHRSMLLFLAIGIGQVTASGTVILAQEFGRVLEEVVVVYCKALSEYLHNGVEEKLQKTSWIKVTVL